jgi:hypothetical protein
MAWQTPKTDWATNPKNPKSEDFNRIEGNIEFLKTDIETKKGLIVNAISDMNQPALVTDTHAELANKIRSISSDANAATGDVEKGKTFYSGGAKKTGTLELTGDAATGNVLSGKTFYNTDLKTKFTGTMPNRGKAIITPGTVNKPIAQGYHDGTGYVVGDADLKAANIRKGVDIFGVTGSLAEAPWFNDWSAYSTEYNWSGAGTSIAAESWGTLLTKLGEGALCFLRSSTVAHVTNSFAANPDIRITVDGVPYVFSGSHSSTFSYVPAYAAGNILFQPIYFKQSLKVEVYNNFSSAQGFFLDYTCLLRNGTPDPSSHTILGSPQRLMADLHRSGTLLSITGVGYLLGILIGGQAEYDYDPNDVKCTITVNGQTIMNARQVFRIHPANLSSLLFVFTGPIRFTSGCTITIQDGSRTRSYSRAWYVLD